MSKNFLDEYIGDYIYSHFQDMRNPFILRDNELESKIINIQKLECLLRSKFTTKEYLNLALTHNMENRLPECIKKIPINYRPRIHCLVKYCEKNSITIEDALEEYADDIQNLNINERKHAITRRGHINEYTHNADISYFFSDETGYIFFEILLFYFQDSKIQFPIFTKSESCSFFLNIFLFNLYFLFNNIEATVILTDSIELAKKNQIYLHRKQIVDIVWISWYGGIEAVEQIDWTPLEGRKVYYLLKEHSGMGTEQIYKTALKVKEQFGNGKNFTLTYISLFSDPSINKAQSMIINNSPVIWDSHTFIRYANGGYPKIQYNYDFYTYNRRILENLNSKPILKPFIYSNWVTFIYGPASAKTWLGLSIAASVKYGEKLWDEVCSNVPSSVLYIHGTAEVASILNRLHKLEKRYTDKPEKSTKPIECVSLAELPPLLGSFSDIRLINEEIDKFKKKYGNFPALIILDSTEFIKTLQEGPRARAEIDSFILDLKMKNSAILIIHNVQNNKKREISNIYNNLRIDSLIKINKKKSLCPSKIAISVSFKSGSRGKNPKHYQQVEIDLNSSSPKWELLTTKRSKEENMTLINNYLLKDNIKDADIANILNITLNTVKKLKQKLRENHKGDILKYYHEKGLSEHEISIKLKLAQSLVSTVINKDKSKDKGGY